MNNIFVFTATGPKPKAHLDVSINSPFTEESYKKYLKNNKIIDAIDAIGECYCWGNTAKSFSNGRWLDIEIDDYVLCYQDGYYTHFSQIIGKEHNKEFAELIWGNDYWEDQDKWKWWEYMYFLKKPQQINIHWKSLPEIRSLYMQDGREQNQPYRGFTNISAGTSNEDRISKIITQYSSIESYFEQKLNIDFPEEINQSSHDTNDEEDFGTPPIKYGSGGESERHKKLKLYIKNNPEVIEIENVVNRKDERYYPTGDHVDVWFEDSHGKKYVVEIELEGDENLLLGAKQLIKYRALEAVENDWYEKDSRVKAVLVAYNYDGNKTEKFCSKYDIDIFQVDKKDID